MRTIARSAVALLPLAVTPLLVQAISRGRIDLGGGEKDLVIVIPWLLWSLIFALGSLLFWRRGWTLARSTAWAALAGAAGLLAAAVCLALFGQLGVAGRF